LGQRDILDKVYIYNWNYFDLELFIPVKALKNI